MAKPLFDRIPSGGGAASLAEYQAGGGYLGLGAARAAGPVGVAELVKKAGLREGAARASPPR